MREWKRAWFAGPRSPFCYTPSCVRVRERDGERDARACVCACEREGKCVCGARVRKIPKSVKEGNGPVIP